MLYRLSHRFSIDGTGRILDVPGIGEAATFYRSGQLDEAARTCRAILQVDPQNFDALHLLGVIHTERNEPNQALLWLTRAEAEQPAAARVQYHLGNALMALERHAEAEERFRRAAALDPMLADAHNNRGTTLRALGRESEAVTCYRRAISARPSFAPAHYNLGLALARRGDLDAAVESFRAALSDRSAPIDKLVEVHDSLAQALMEMQRYEEALEVCRDRVALKPDDPRGEWHEALALLTLGRFEEGLPKYERRWELPGFRTEDEAGSPLSCAPRLAELVGKRVLLRAEQGRGDVIQFARYAPYVAESAASVVLVVPADLVVLMRSLHGIDAVIDDRAPEPDHDIAAALMSLPLTFGTTLESIPGGVPYLRAPADRLRCWAERVRQDDRPRVGLCWWGLQHIPERSLPLAELAPLFGNNHIAFHAVQKEIPELDRAWHARNAVVTLHDTELSDFAETAALLAQMDVVVTIDTAVAHLAGALGRTTWIMLRRSPDWRWMIGREDSPWYPTVRLFRQGSGGGWGEVVARIGRELDRYFAAPR
jgi:tetratricopeptide (TPR) repeat protein